jgi:hypothetical protein
MKTKTIVIHILAAISTLALQSCAFDGVFI